MDALALLLAIGLVFLNGFFVATEFAIVKVRPTRIEELIAQHRPGASAVRHLTRNLDGYLSATQLGITLASLGLGWIGKPAFARVIEWPMHAMGLDDPALIETVAGPATFAIITFLHIVVGELAPKSLAILRAEAVATLAAYPMRLFYLLFWPGIATLNGVANLILRAFGLRTASGHAEQHSEEEIKIILNQARSAGLLSASRADLLRRALSLPAKAARHLMVPRNDVVFLDVNLSDAENLARAVECGHTRFPLCDRELDDVVGIVDVRDIMYHSMNNPVPIATLAKPAAYYPEMMSAERLLHEFRTRHIPMAIIVDEYGGASGIVTAADIVSEVMGDLEEDDDGDRDVVQLPGGVYEVEGTATIEEVETVLKVSLPTDDMRTVAGFLMERLGRMPRAGDRVIEQGYVFHVLDISGPRVRHVRIQRENPKEAAPTAAPKKTAPAMPEP